MLWNSNYHKSRMRLQRFPVKMNKFQVFKLSRFHYDQNLLIIISNIGELQQDYLAKRELESLIDETETSFQKINESIKTLICVVQKQEKHLLVKTAGK